MSGFGEILGSSSEFASVIESVKAGKCPVHVTGMTGSQKSHFIYSLCVTLGKKCIVVTYDEAEAGRISSDLSFLFCRDTFVFKNKDYVFYNIDASSHTAEISRLRTLAAFDSGAPIVTTIEAVSKFTISPTELKRCTITINSDSVVDSAALANRLVAMGYQRTSAVEGEGTFSIRGSIIDVFSPCMSSPVRIDLFDDEVDSIRAFDPATQVSVENISSCTIIPVREIVYDYSKAQEVAATIRRLNKFMSRI